MFHQIQKMEVLNLCNVSLMKTTGKELRNEIMDEKAR